MGSASPNEVLLPRLILGPQSRGRGFGVLARSPTLPIDDSAITSLSVFNHNLVSQIGAGAAMHSLLPVVGAREIWFVSTSRGHLAIDGNPVVVTSGVLLEADQLRRIAGRADLLIGPWLEDIAEANENRLIPPARFAFPDPPISHSATTRKLLPVAPLLGARLVQVHFAPEAEVGRDAAAQALEQIGAMLATAPFERAAGMSWATMALPGASRSLTITRAPLPEQVAAADPAAVGIASDGALLVRCDAASLAAERLWHASLNAVERSVLGGATHARSLDAFRDHGRGEPSSAAVVRERLEAFLDQVAVGFGESGLASWLRLLVDAAIILADAEFSSVVAELLVSHAGSAAQTGAAAKGDPLALLREALLAGGADAPLRKLSDDPALTGRLVLADPDPLAYWMHLTADERMQLVAGLAAPTGGSTAAGETLCEAATVAAGLILDEAGPDDARARTVAALLGEACGADRTPAAAALRASVAPLARLCFAANVAPALRREIRSAAEKLLDRYVGSEDPRGKFASLLAEQATIHLKNARSARGRWKNGIDSMALTVGIEEYLAQALRPMAAAASGARR